MLNLPVIFIDVVCSATVHQMALAELNQTSLQESFILRRRMLPRQQQPYPTSGVRSALQTSILVSDLSKNNLLIIS